VSLTRRNFVQTTSASLVRFIAPPLAIASFSGRAQADGGATLALALAIGAIIASRIAAHNTRSTELILLKDLEQKIDLLLDSNLALLNSNATILRTLAALPGEIAEMLKGQTTSVLINSLLGVQEQTLQLTRLEKKHGQGFMGRQAAQGLLADARRDLNRERFRLYKTADAYSPAVMAVVTAASQADLLLLNLLHWPEVAEDLIDNVYLPWLQRAVDQRDPMGLPAYRRKAEAERTAAIDQITKSRLGTPLIEGQESVVGASILTVDEAPARPESSRYPGLMGRGYDGLPGLMLERTIPANPRTKDHIWFDATLERQPIEQTAAMGTQLSEAGGDLATVPVGTAGIEWLILTANHETPYRQTVAAASAFPWPVPPGTVTLHVDIPDDWKRLQYMFQQPAWSNAKVEVAALASVIDTVNLASARIGLANQVEETVKQSIEHLTRIRRSYS
jgi:hypothetical protein